MKLQLVRKIDLKEESFHILRDGEYVPGTYTESEEEARQMFIRLYARDGISDQTQVIEEIEV